MKDVYIVFIASNFKTGKAIRFLTRGRYNHVALSFEPVIDTLYSYARYNYYEPILGGYGAEYPNRYLANGEDVPVRVCRYPVTDEHYQRIKDSLQVHEEQKTDTRYNFFSLVTYPFGVDLHIHGAHTCISFLRELLEIEGFVSINRLARILENDIVFEGNLSGTIEPMSPEKDAQFYIRHKRLQIWYKSCLYMAGLFLSLAEKI